MRRNALIGTLVLMTSICAGDGLAPGDHSMVVTSSFDGTTQPYRLFIPPDAGETSGALPLAVVLHGWGADHAAWFNFTPVKRIAGQYGYIVAAPYGRGNWWYRGPAERDVLDIVEDVKRLCNVDRQRIHLAGHSMGGWGTWWIGTRNPDLFASISPMSGFDPGAFVANARNLAPFVIHDQLDPVVPVTNSRAPAQRLAGMGVSHQYREEIGYGHASRMIGDNLPAVFEWFNRHTAVQKPRRVTVMTRTPSNGSSAWLRILETSDFPKPGSVDGYIDSTGTVVLSPDRVRSFAVNLRDLPSSASVPVQLEIGGWKAEVPGKRGWVVVSRAKRGGAWTHEMTSKAPEAALPWILTGKAAESIEVAAGSEDKLATAVARLLLKRIDADVCVLDADKLRLPPGSLTAGKLLDIWVYPDDRLARFRCRAGNLERAEEPVSKRPACVYPADIVKKGTRMVSVVMPVAIARQFPEFGKSGTILPDTIGEILCSECAK